MGRCLFLQRIWHGLFCVRGYGTDHCLNVNSFIPQALNSKLQMNERYRKLWESILDRVHPIWESGNRFLKKWLEFKFVVCVVTSWNWQKIHFLYNEKYGICAKVLWCEGGVYATNRKEGLGPFCLLKADNVIEGGTKLNQRSR